MSFNMADIKAAGRRAVNDMAAVPILFHTYDKQTNSHLPPLADPLLKARYHSVIRREGLIEGEGAERLIEIDRVVFDREVFTTLGVSPKQHDKIEFLDYGFVVSLDVRKPYDGPVEETWLVVML